ncbi:MAG: helix-turn-helix transcriptional regulator [Bacteroidota bacterium]
MSFGKRLMEVRKDRGLSQEDLATLIGTKGPAIGRYERGAANPTIEVAIRLADALDVSLDYLVGKVDMAIDANTLKRLKEIANLPEEDQQFILRAMDGLLRDIKTQRAYAS